MLCLGLRQPYVHKLEAEHLKTLEGCLPELNLLHYILKTMPSIDNEPEDTYMLSLNSR